MGGVIVPQEIPIGERVQESGKKDSERVQKLGKKDGQRDATNRMWGNDCREA